jgi:fatty-acyl-CoA synthase/long-chain acyl-CoA synthetase
MPDWIEATTVGDLLVRLAATAPKETAVVLPPDRLTGQELLDRVVQRARGLSALGIDRGTNVGLLMPNCLEFIETFFALAMLGAVTVPINIRHQPVELEHVITNGQLTAIVTTDGTTEKIDFPDLLRRCLPPLPHHSGSLSLDGLPRLRRLIMIGGDGAPGFVDQAELDQRAESVSLRDIDTYRSRVRIRDVALLLYTSGTTSKAKGCQLSHEAVARTGMARFAERPDAGRGAVWTPCPLFHVGALVPLIGCVGTGATFLTTRGFDAGETLRLLEAERITTALPLVPAFTDALMDHRSFATTDLSSLQQILSTGTRQKVERVQKAFAPAKLVSGYGMTELCGVAASSELDESSEVRLDWDGRPFRGIEM